MAVKKFTFKGQIIFTLVAAVLFAGSLAYGGDFQGEPVRLEHTTIR